MFAQLAGTLSETTSSDAGNWAGGGVAVNVREVEELSGAFLSVTLM